MLSPLEIEVIALSLRVAFWAGPVQLAAGDRGGLDPGADNLPRQSDCRWRASLAVGGAARCRGLYAVGSVRPPRCDRGISLRDRRHFVRLRLEGRGPGGGRHGVPVDGTRDPVVDRGDRSAPRNRGTYFGRKPASGFCNDHSAVGVTWNIGRHRVGVCAIVGEFGATITFASNIPGETRTLPLAIFSLTQTPGAQDAILRLVLISIAIALAALIVSEMLSRRVTARIRGDAA